jgi:hypothetical protein
VYLTPAHLADFSAKEAVIRFDVSTLKTSTRDWWDVWVTPVGDSLAIPGETWYPDLSGPPKRAVHIKMADFQEGKTGFIGEMFDGFAATDLPGDRWTTYESVLTPDAKRRDTFELHVSRTHVKFGMPAYNLWWIDADISPLGWSQGLVQIGHHSYNPTKCDGCSPNTWHWDNIGISPSTPVRLIESKPAGVAAGGPSMVSLDAPAPAGARLRFVALGRDLQVSFDRGATWTAATRHAIGVTQAEEHVSQFWTPLPAGANTVSFTAKDWFGGKWVVRDVAVWAASTPSAPGS